LVELSRVEVYCYGVVMMMEPRVPSDLA
jgi:hypothetical protein